MAPPRVAAMPAAAQVALSMAPAVTASGATSTAPSEDKPAKPEPPKPPAEQVLFRAEAEARLRKQLEARAGFVERLVAFWSNHFAVSVAKSNELRVAAGPFEREAIRPNVLGKFSTLLRAAESHPAMILYPRQPELDRPRRRAGKIRRARPERESGARDSWNCIRWASGPATRRPMSPSSRASSPAGASRVRTAKRAQLGRVSMFKPNWHEPGARKLLGKTYAGSRRRAGTRGVRRSRTPSGDGDAISPPSSCATSSPTIRRPDLVASACARSSSTATATSRSLPLRSSRTTGPGAPQRSQDPHAARIRRRRGASDRFSAA